MSALTNAERQWLLQRALDLGFSQAEIDGQLGTGATLGNRTVREAIGFLRHRRQKLRYNAQSGTWVPGAAVGPAKAIGQLEREVV